MVKLEKQLEELRKRAHELHNFLKREFQKALKEGKTIKVFTGVNIEDSDSWAPSLDWGGGGGRVVEYKDVRFREIDDDPIETWYSFEIGIKKAIEQGVDNDLTRAYRELKEVEEKIAEIRRKIACEKANIVQKDKDLQELYEFIVGKKNNISKENKYVRILLDATIPEDVLGEPYTINDIHDIKFVIDPYGDLPMMTEDTAMARVYDKITKIVNHFLEDLSKAIDNDDLERAERNPLIQAIVRKGVHYKHIYANNQYLETIEIKISNAKEALNLVLDELEEMLAFSDYLDPDVEDCSRVIKKILESKPKPS